MFDNTITAGKHMICDLKNIKNMDLLNDMDILDVFLEMICNNHQFQIVNRVQKNFEPQGCTILYLLSESHLSIHTFPERNFLSFDLYTCREYKDNTEYLQIYDSLLYYLNADKEKSTCQIIDRYFLKNIFSFV
jgi:hypothetical protein